MKSMACGFVREAMNLGADGFGARLKVSKSAGMKIP